MTWSVGVDIGGTKIAAGVVDDDGTIVVSTQRPTPSASGEIANVVADLVAGLRGDHDVAHVGVGAAGFISSDRRTIRFAPNIDWRDVPFGEQVESLVGLPVVVENDANAAAWAESRFGAGRGVEDLLMVTVGTGVGGGVVLGGRLVRGGFGIAAEVGHLRVVPDGIPCGCGQRGCLEQYASGSALVRSARELVESCDPDAAALGALHDLDGAAVTRLAQDGDPASVALLAEVGRWLGEGVASMAALLDPTAVVVGGGASAAGDLLLSPMRAAYADHLPARHDRPVAEIRAAALGNDAGLVGAADLARSDPR